MTVSSELVDGRALELLVEWLYTGRAKVEVSLEEDLRRLCRQCRLAELSQQIEDAVLKAHSFGN